MTDQLEAAAAAIDAAVQRTAATESAKRATALAAAIEVCEAMKDQGIDVNLGRMHAFMVDAVEEAHRQMGEQVRSFGGDPASLPGDVEGLATFLARTSIKTLRASRQMQERQRINAENIIARSNGPLG